MSTTSLHISLPEALKDFIQERVREGAYSNPSDYVRALVRADRERMEKRAALQRNLAVGLDQLERGEGQPFDERTVEQIKQRGRARLSRSG